MLGDILNHLTDPATAETALAMVIQAELRDRVASAAAAEGCPVGMLVAGKIRHLLDHGGEELWLDLLGAMAASPQPGAVAVNRIVALAFPAPARVRITRIAG